MAQVNAAASRLIRNDPRVAIHQRRTPSRCSPRRARPSRIRPSPVITNVMIRTATSGVEPQMMYASIWGGSKALINSAAARASTSSITLKTAALLASDRRSDLVCTTPPSLGWWRGLSR